MTRHEVVVASAVTAAASPVILVAVVAAWMRWERWDGIRAARTREGVR